MIAASAIVEDCILISADTLFPEIVNIDQRLKLEDWTIH